MASSIRSALVLFPIMLVACSSGPSTQARLGPGTSLHDYFGFTDQTPRSIGYDELRQGCPKVDCIPAIDHPKFVAAADVDFLVADDLLLSVTRDGITRGYPTVILDQHEIVNDVIAGVPIAATWCPLCGSALAFDRRVDGTTMSFGVSGYLHETDLVMFDRQSRSFWIQVTGEAVIGQKTGQQLNQLPSSMLTWSEWQVAHPKGQVLSTDTGFRFQYAGSMYRDYHRNDGLMFPISNKIDERLPAKTVVYGLRWGETAIAIPESVLREAGHVEFLLGQETIRVGWPNQEQANVVATTSTGEVPMTRLFWFAWANFNPGSRIVP